MHTTHHGDDAHADHHDHHDHRHQSKSRLWLVLVLALAFMSAEAVVGLYTGSLALIADAAHMLSDAGAIGLALFAFWFAAKPATHAKSYGFHRTEILASLANSVVLLGVSLFVLFEAGKRIFQPTEVLSGPMIWIAIAGLIVNFISVKLLHASAEHSLNMKGAYLEVLSDLIGCAGVLIAALIIKFTGWYWVDAAVSGLIGLMIVPRTIKLLCQSVNILMEGTPSGVDVHAMEHAIKGVDNVVNVHDLHVWTLTSGLDAMSAHVHVEDERSLTTVLNRVKTLLETQFKIRHSTIQTEVVACETACNGCQNQACH